MIFWFKSNSNISTIFPKFGSRFSPKNGTLPWSPTKITGWWFGCHQFYIFSSKYWVSVKHPKWRTNIFFRGVAQPPRHIFSYYPILSHIKPILNPYYPILSLYKVQSNASANASGPAGFPGCPLDHPDRRSIAVLLVGWLTKTRLWLDLYGYVWL